MRAHQASRTAVKISRLVLYVADDPRRAALLPMGAAEATEALLRAAGLLQDWHLRVYRSQQFRSMLAWTERKLLPGQTTHVALRKRVLHDETRAGLEAGASQVLIVGAGFDTLALRLARAHPGVRFVEIDHPATQSLKRHALDQLDPPPNLRLYPADLGLTSLPDVLDQLEWDRSARGVAVAEGVLMYLGEHEVADFMRGLGEALGSGSRMLGTYVVPDERGRPQLGRLGWLSRASLEAMGEPLRWSPTPEALGALLHDAGFSMRDAPGRVDLRLRYLVPAGLDDLPLATVERVFIADRD
ncbi:class I SAM-dependent methyltransferase [Paraliomyxa miuraensis]|uniref:class I SAM-dependent methyltransferase n=1 Tax=Paraliomyxa miuraensis TaxID=376150 RepID=UPI0022537F3E|nr:SAM-dependent methyltransferase [Paraliomyxa miuraensis]MCX4246008.1 SAM-dependent methyltransferase [Paraliomyxa miuraensis]